MVERLPEFHGVKLKLFRLVSHVSTTKKALDLPTEILEAAYAILENIAQFHLSECCQA